MTQRTCDVTGGYRCIYADSAYMPGFVVTSVGETLRLSLADGPRNFPCTGATETRKAWQLRHQFTLVKGHSNKTPLSWQDGEVSLLERNAERHDNFSILNAFFCRNFSLFLFTCSSLWVQLGPIMSTSECLICLPVKNASCFVDPRQSAFVDSILVCPSKEQTPSKCTR
jgi:hypothetical protein